MLNRSMMTNERKGNLMFENVLIGVVGCALLALVVWACVQQMRRHLKETLTLREKSLIVTRYYNYFPLSEETIKNDLAQLREQLHGKFGEHLPDDASITLASVEEALMKTDLKSREIALAEVYEKHFTESEIDTLYAFTQTPAGQKLFKQESLHVLLDNLFTTSNAWLLQHLEPHRQKMTQLLDVTPAPVAAPEQATEWTPPDAA